MKFINAIVRAPRRTARRLLRRWREARDDGGIRVGTRDSIQQLNEWQTYFCAWQAVRTGVTQAEMERRFLASLNSLPGGHGGRNYGHYCTLSYALFMPFANDSESEVMEAYNFHAPMLFLRMLSYRFRSWPDDHPAVNLAKDHVAIIDFGCGLAQNSFSLARKLRERGKSVHLFLTDVLRLQLEFLEWLGAREGFPTTCTLCTASDPIPSFPPADVLIAEEVLEHVHDPVRYVEQLDHLLKPGGIFIANVRKHDAGFMHVSPDLGKARVRLLELGYAELEPEQMFRKHEA